MSNKILISGRSYHQCLQYMRGKNVSDYAWRFVWERHSLRGLRGLTLVALEGTPFDVIQQAHIQDFKVVKDYVPELLHGVRPDKDTGEGSNLKESPIQNEAASVAKKRAKPKS